MTDKQLEKEQEKARVRLWNQSSKCWGKLNKLTADSHLNPESEGPFNIALKALDALCHSSEK